MNFHPPVEQASGCVVGVIHLDIDGDDALTTVCELGRVRLGSRLQVYVGPIAPWALPDLRILHFLLEACRDRALNVEIHGTPAAVNEWLHLLQPPPPPPPNPGATQSRFQLVSA